MSTVASICPESGCGALTLGGPCGPHKRKRAKKENARRNSHPRRKVYDDPRWTTTRVAVFMRDEFNCQGEGCDYHGLRLVCDHIEPIATLIREGRDPFNPDECQTLCARCSGRKDGARGAGR